jgi:predicted phosphodiesterase
MKHIEERDNLLDASLIYCFGNCDFDEDVDQNPYEPPKQE